MARSQSQKLSSARSELSNATKNVGAWKNLDESLDQITNTALTRAEEAYERRADGDRFNERDSILDKQNAFINKGYGLAKTIGDFIAKTKDTEKYPQIEVGGDKGSGRTAFDKFKDLKIIDNLMDDSWDKIKNKILKESRDAIGYAYKKTTGEVATEADIDGIIKDEVEPKMERVREFVNKSIDDSVYKKNYTPLELFDKAKKFHQNEVFDVSFDTPYNKNIMNVINAGADKYIKQIEKEIKKL